MQYTYTSRHLNLFYFEFCLVVFTVFKKRQFSEKFH